MPLAPAPVKPAPANTGGNTAIELARLRKELAETQAKLAQSNEKGKPKVRRIEVSQKGAISLYGLGRFPTTLYVEGMEAVLDAAPEIRAFITANRSRLKTKAAD